MASSDSFSLMAKVIPFPSRVLPDDEEPEVDLLTAVDVAIRDLTDIQRRWGEESSRRQAEACRRMLERALDAASDVK